MAKVVFPVGMCGLLVATIEKFDVFFPNGEVTQQQPLLRFLGIAVVVSMKHVILWVSRVSENFQCVWKTIKEC